MAIFNGGAGNDVLRGTNHADLLNGGAGDDTLSGGGGTDVLFGGAGRDTLDGGSGSDVVDGGLGDDLLIYRFGENKGAYDVYNGGLGTDTLRLVFTAAEWDQAAVRQDVHRFLAYLPAYNEPLGWITNPAFAFRSMGLAVVGVNKLEVVVDGRVINAADMAVVAVDDTAATTENEGVTVDVLANDKVADGVRSVSVTQPTKGSVELVSSDFTGSTPSAVFRFVPGDAFDALKAGETAIQVFTYTVTDKDGDARTATVQVKVTGTNDAPEVQADVAALNADGTVGGNVATNDRDVDGDELTFYVSGWEVPVGFEMNSDGSWTFDPHYTTFWGESEARTVDALKAGETLTYEIPYRVYDPSYAAAQGTLTITVTGVNDAAILQNTQDVLYESRFFDWAVADGVSSQTGLLNILDWDGVDGEMVVTITGSSDDNLGTLVLTGYDAESGRYGYRYEIGTDALAALAEGEERTEMFQLRIDDGQGSVTTQSFGILIEGDGNDPIDVPDYPLFPDDPIDADGVRTNVYVIVFNDSDYFDTYSASVAWADPDALGEVSAKVIVDEDGDYYVEVTSRVPLSEVDALTGGLEQTFRVTLSDNAGSTVEFDRTVQLAGAAWHIGDGADDQIVAYDDASGRDIVVGGGGSDRLVGGTGRDQLFGDAGPELPADQENSYGWWPETWTPVEGFDDELDGGAGADQMTGGAGADRFVFRRGETNGDVITDFSSADGDRLIFFDWGDGAAVTRLEGNRWQVTSGDGRTREVITLANGVELTDADFVFQARDVEWRVGGDGDDDLTTYDGEVRNVLVGGAGRDNLAGAIFADELYGDEGPARPADEENLFDGSENWSSGEYDDELNGYGGADLLVGGSGGDRFIFGRGEADGDVVRDFNGAEGDRLDFTDFGYGATLTRIDATTWRVADADREHVETITLANGAGLTADDVLIRTRDIEWWIGGEGDDRLSTPGGEIRYVLIGGAGRDYLLGDDHADELYGDAGPTRPGDKENLFDGTVNETPGEYDDVLDGFGGADLLVGGAGADLFVFDEGEANGDVVRDFNGAEGDRLDFTEYGMKATFTRIDATHWEIATFSRSFVEVITFTNAPDITPDHLIML